MVPVPEELVADVKRYLQWNLLLPSRANDNPNAIAEVFEAATGPMRVIVHRVAEEILRNGPISLAGLAEELEISTHEVLGLCHDLNGRISGAGGPPVLVMPQPDPSERPEDRTEFDHRVLMMAAKHADTILNL